METRSATYDPPALSKQAKTFIVWGSVIAFCLGFGLLALAGVEMGNDYADCVDSYGSDWCHQQTVEGKSINPVP